MYIRGNYELNEIREIEATAIKYAEEAAGEKDKQTKEALTNLMRTEIQKMKLKTEEYLRVINTRA